MQVWQNLLDCGQAVLIDAEPAEPFNNRLAAKYHLRKGPDGRHCKDCAHHYTKEYANLYHKCDQVTETNGPGTDIRVRWDACERFAEKTGDYGLLVEDGREWLEKAHPADVALPQNVQKEIDRQRGNRNRP